MDTANDNPLKRFSSFWLGVLLFGAFGLVGLLLGLWYSKPSEDAFDVVNRERRKKIKAEIGAAQAGAREAAAKSFEKVGAAFLASIPAPVEQDGFILPGSETANSKTAAGDSKIAVPADFPSVPADAPVDPAVMEAGKTAYLLCSTCHGADGKGMPSLGPPFDGSEWVLGPVENLIAIQLRGLTGPIDVKGTTFKPVAPMPAQFFQDDNTIAAVITYIRNSFGNKAGPVLPEQVKALRGEVGKPPLTQADLIPPSTGSGSAGAAK